jgi:tetratricopeptide (TPR) repeat protein
LLDSRCWTIGADLMYRLKWIIILQQLLVILAINATPCYAQTAEQNTYVRILKSGMEQMKGGHYDAARAFFDEATRYNDSDSAGHLGLGIAYYHLKDDRAAERELTRAVELSPNEAVSYQFLGELYYRKDDFETAASYWEKAVSLNPSDTNLRARLERIRKENRTERDFNREVTSHFLTKYEGREMIDAGRIVLRILEEAYSEVGHALSYYPDQEIQVILYSNRQFQEVTDAPDWSSGIFDGKIRIPAGGIDKETPALRRILYHEYTHAVIRSITPHCPTWLNEGLAQYLEGSDINGRQRSLLRQLAETGKLPSLSNLEGSFLGLNSSQAMNAYLFSLSSVRYMIDSFGLYRVKAVLDELAAGADMPKAISNGNSISYEEFERGWKRSLE